MNNNRSSRQLTALASVAAALLFSPPVFALPTETVQGTYKVSGNSTGASAFFTKAKGTNKIFSISQSSLIAEMFNLDRQSQSEPPSTQLSFTLLGDPANPNGGLLVRFPGFTIPSLLPDFGGATPDAATKFTFYNGDSVIYTIDYDGFSDFPKYPINLISEQYPLLGYNFNANFKDIGVPQSAQITKVKVKFSLKKPGKIAIGEANILLPGINVITKNKIDLSGN